MFTSLKNYLESRKNRSVMLNLENNDDTTSRALFSVWERYDGKTIYSIAIFINDIKTEKNYDISKEKFFKFLKTGSENLFFSKKYKLIRARDSVSNFKSFSFKEV